MRSRQLLCLSLGLATLAVAQDVDPPGRVGRLSFLSGTVTFQPAGLDDWINAPLNRPLTMGDRLWVDGDGRAELHIGAASLKLNSRTAFEFLNLDDQNVQIRLGEGVLEIKLRGLSENESFEVDTPNLAFSLLRPGTYRIEANPDTQTTTITVRGGEGEVNGGGQAFGVHARQQARVTGDQSVTYDVLNAPPPDWFDNWCDSRDRREEQSESARYVPRDLIGYEDLDGSGVWSEEPEYGHVWHPRAMPAGWAPYRYGHWAFIEPWGWTWVDDAPWGFAPFHYGRWAIIGGSWGWVPGPAAVRPVYAPALVAFVGGPRLSASISVGGGAGVAWFPLGPREVFVPAYRTSAAYVTRVNTTNTVINNVTINNVYNNRTSVTYVNQSSPGAMTAVSRETFTSARPVGRAMVAVPRDAVASAQVVRGAQVAPNRVSVAGNGSVASARPPAAVMERPVVARRTPPPAPVPFARREQMLQQNQGQPLDNSQVNRVRGPQVQRSVRMASAPPTGGPGNPQVQQGPRPGEMRSGDPARPQQIQIPQAPVNPQAPPNPRPEEMRRGEQNRAPQPVQIPQAVPVNPQAPPNPRPEEMRRGDPRRAPQPAQIPQAAPVNPQAPQNPRPEEVRRGEQNRAPQPMQTPQAAPVNPQAAPNPRPEEMRRGEPARTPQPIQTPQATPRAEDLRRPEPNPEERRRTDPARTQQPAPHVEERPARPESRPVRGEKTEKREKPKEVKKDKEETRKP